MAFVGVAPTVRWQTAPVFPLAGNPAGAPDYPTFKNYVRLEFPAAALAANLALGAGFADAGVDSGTITTDNNAAGIANYTYIGGGLPAATLAGGTRNELLSQFGRGTGLWQAGDERFLFVQVEDSSIAIPGGLGQTSDVKCVQKGVQVAAAPPLTVLTPVLVPAAPVIVGVAAGNMVMRFYNRGLQASGAFAVNIWWMHSINL